LQKYNAVCRKTEEQYPEQIRRIIDATNAIENFNRQLRKVTKTKSALAGDDALLKRLYLVTMRVTGKWTMPVKDWGSILMRLITANAQRG
jgi:transposase-like protein